jgi:hypothetical protein
MGASMSTIKEEVFMLVERLPDSVSRGEVMYALYVRQKIAGGEMALVEERTVAHEAVKKRFTSV